MIKNIILKSFVFFFIVLTCFLNSRIAFSNEKLLGTLKNIDTPKELLVGDLFKAKIEILPLQSAIPSEIRKSLYGKVFLDYFFVSDIESISFSKNNSEVLEIYLTLVLNKAYEKKEFYIWSYKALNIPFEIKNINASKNPSKIKEYITHNQKEESKFNLPWWVYFAAILITIILVPFFLKKISANKSKKLLFEERRKNKSYWQNKFDNASDRLELEDLVTNQIKWQGLITVEQGAMNEFIFELKKNMYKKEWSEQTQEKIKSLFQKVRPNFKDKKK